MTLGRAQESFHGHTGGATLVHGRDGGGDFVQTQRGHVVEVAVHARLAA